MNKQEKTAFIGATIYILLAIVSTVDIFFTTIKNEGVIGLIAAFWISKLYIIPIPFLIFIAYKILAQKKPSPILPLIIFLLFPIWGISNLIYKQTVLATMIDTQIIFLVLAYTKYAVLFLGVPYFISTSSRSKKY